MQYGIILICSYPIGLLGEGTVKVRTVSSSRPRKFPVPPQETSEIEYSDTYEEMQQSPLSDQLGSGCVSRHATPKRQESSFPRTPMHRCASELIPQSSRATESFHCQYAKGTEPLDRNPEYIEFLAASAKNVKLSHDLQAELRQAQRTKKTWRRKSLASRKQMMPNRNCW